MQVLSTIKLVTWCSTTVQQCVDPGSWDQPLSGRIIPTCDLQEIEMEIGASLECELGWELELSEDLNI